MSSGQPDGERRQLLEAARRVDRANGYSGSIATRIGQFGRQVASNSDDLHRMKSGSIQDGQWLIAL